MACVRMVDGELYNQLIISHCDVVSFSIKKNIINWINIQYIIKYDEM